jgi:hypothetical protein
VTKLSGRETRCLTLRDEHRLREFENRVLRRIFRPKREEVAGGWRRLHTEKLHNLYASQNITRTFKSRWMRWSGHAARVAKVKSAYIILVRKPEWNRPRGRPTCR